MALTLTPSEADKIQSLVNDVLRVVMEEGATGPSGEVVTNMLKPGEFDFVIPPAKETDPPNKPMARALAGLVAAAIIRAQLTALPITLNVTAAAAGTQADATPLAIGISVVSAVAAAGHSVVLPGNATLGTADVWVANTSVNPVAVFPPLGGSINGLATDASLTLPAGASYIFVRVSDMQWVSYAGVSTIPSATSPIVVGLGNLDSGLLRRIPKAWARINISEITGITLVESEGVVSAVGILGTPAAQIEVTLATGVPDGKAVSWVSTSNNNYHVSAVQMSGMVFRISGSTIEGTATPIGSAYQTISLMIFA